MDLIKKDKVPFTQVANSVLCDPNLSLRAKGLYAYLFSKPDDWQFHRDVIEKETKESYETFKTAVNELIVCGYVTREQYKDEKNKKFGGMVYTFLIAPQNPNRCAKKPLPEKHRNGEKPSPGKTVDGKTLSHNNTDCLSNTDSNPYNPQIGDSQSPDDFDSRNQGKNLSDQPKDRSKTNPDKFFPGSSGSKDDEQIPSMESLRVSKNKESSQNQKFLRGESNTNIVQLTNEESVNDRVFEDLWQAYVPYVTQDGRSTNKGSKKLAKEKFMKTVSKGANPYDILRGTRRYIEDCNNRKTLTKNVPTFLNQEQWRDYLVACNIKNNHPLNISGLTPFSSKEDFMGFFSQEIYKPFINDNPSFFETIQNIRTGLTNGNIEKSILMAQELANEVWEYKDTTQIKNSILDPILWALCRFEINPRESKSAIMIVGYFLRRLWLEEKRRLVENKS